MIYLMLPGGSRFLCMFYYCRICFLGRMCSLSLSVSRSYRFLSPCLSLLSLFPFPPYFLCSFFPFIFRFSKFRCSMFVLPLIVRLFFFFFRYLFIYLYISFFFFVLLFFRFRSSFFCFLFIVFRFSCSFMFVCVLKSFVGSSSVSLFFFSSHLSFFIFVPHLFRFSFPLYFVF